MFTKQAILAAGFDMNREGIDFSKMCEARMAFLRRKFSKEKLRVTIFDFGRGTVKSYEPNDKGKITVADATHSVTVPNPAYDPIADPRKEVVLQKTYDLKPVNGENYSNWDKKAAAHTFNQNKIQRMSVTDIYSFVQDIGLGVDAGTVVELSFYAHGWEHGPVFVNSDEDHPEGRARETDDRDGRQKDFLDPNMNEKQLGSFKKAFDTGALIWSWGCAFPAEMNVILGTFFKSPVSKGKARIKDTERLKLEFSLDKKRDNGPDIFEKIQKVLSRFGRLNKAGDFVVQLTMGDLKDVFRAGLEDTYANSVAKGTGLTAIQALTGTYAQPFDGMMGVMQDKDRGKWESTESAKVARNPKLKAEPFESWTRSINFYKNYFGRTIDPENRGYGVFRP
jgi:hypothetical protein